MASAQAERHVNRITWGVWHQVLIKRKEIFELFNRLCQEILLLSWLAAAALFKASWDSAVAVK